MVTKDYYKLLQVDPSADPKEIAAAYRRQAKKLHPDKDSSPTANKQMQELNEAWENLREPHKRKA